MTAPLLQIEDLHVSYGHIQALKGISLSVREKEVVAILGANGAGKTTLMRTLSGLLTPKSGKITFAGHDTTRMGADRIVRLGIGQSPEGRRVFGTLSVAENLRMGGFTRPIAEIDASCEHVYKIFPRLYERRAQLAGTLSGGEQQMLAIGRALMTNPHLLILDEATEGLAPLIREEIWRCLDTLRGQGQAILVIDKYVQRLVRLADRHTLIERGRVVWRGESAALAASPELWQRYIGI